MLNHSLELGATQSTVQSQPVMENEDGICEHVLRVGEK
jgi:hypothetical protein